MHCYNCGTQVNEGTAYCPRCGAPQQPQQQPQQPAYGVPQQQAYAQQPQQAYAQAAPPPQAAYAQQAPLQPAPRKKKGKGLRVLLIILLALVVVAGTLAGLVAAGIVNLPNGLNPFSKSSSAVDVKEDEEAVEEEKDSSKDIDEEEGGTPAETSTTPAAAAPAADSDYVIPDSNKRYLTTSDLTGLTTLQLYYARNEIYARHGRGFNSATLREYFATKSWYTELYTPEAFDAMPSPLSDIELKNATMILEYEKSIGSPYAG
jgi:hypothetical protein